MKGVLFMRIKCPNCKNIIDLKTDMCPECSFNIYKYMNDNGFLDKDQKIIDNVYVCPKCGNLGNISIEKIKTLRFHCNKCGSLYKPSKLPEKDYWDNLDYYINPKHEYDLVLETVGDIIDLDSYNKEYEERLNTFEQSEISYQQEKKTKREKQESITHCPKCNGTSFTPVRKKFSLFAGFATNKIELVCNNCGTVVKPK